MDYLFRTMLSIANVYLFILGWHHRANAKAGHTKELLLFRLCLLLLQEAKLVESRVSSDNLCLEHLPRIGNWRKLGIEISSGHFLRLCGPLNLPRD